MSLHRTSRQHPEIGRIAARLLTVPVMSIALLACYVGLRWSLAEPEPASVTASAANAVPVTSEAVPVAPAATSRDQAITWTGELHDLDPVGAGRDPAP